MTVVFPQQEQTIELKTERHYGKAELKNNMNIRKTTHKRIEYRNGEFGLLLTTEKIGTSFRVLTMKDKTGCIIHHSINGKYLGTKDEFPLDIIWIEE
jgi:hypothetical protein